MDNITEKVKAALPEKEVPSGFDELIKNAYNPKFKPKETPVAKNSRAYIFLLAAIVFIVLIIVHK